MKKLILAGLVLCGLFVAQHSYSQDTSSSGSMYAQNTAANASMSNQGQMMGQDSRMMAQDGRGQDGRMMGGQSYAYNQDSGSQYWSRDGRSWNQGSCGIEGCEEPRADHACDDQASGECWCKYVHYQPCYYYTKRCVQENKYCTKRCCRQVPQCYEVQRCRYVPQYYTETCTRYVPQYYDVQECIPCQKWVCDRHCKYTPCYYWKHVCGKPECTTPCPTQACCP